MSYEDTVLIKLRRDYSKDEVVMFALNKVKEKNIEIGKLKSYIQELEDNPVKLAEKEYIDSLKSEIQELKNKYRKLLEARPISNKKYSDNEELIAKLNLQVKILKEDKSELKKNNAYLKSLEKISSIENIKIKNISLEKKLQKQIKHGNLMDLEKSFFYKKIKSILTEDEIQVFYKERDEFRKEALQQY